MSTVNVTIVRYINGMLGSRIMLEVPRDITVEALIERVNSPIQVEHLVTWHVPTLIRMLNGNGGGYVVWDRNRGFLTGFKGERQEVALSAYERIVDPNLNSQKYGEMILDINYDPIPDRPRSDDDGGGDEMSIDSRCRVCNAASKTLQQCKQCKSVLYCDAQCQDKDWHHGGHKDVCSAK